ncbi:MAG: LPS assembly protein LptD [bacterium]|nr:LPS assembly protein LptD [bacterium]
MPEARTISIEERVFSLCDVGRRIWAVLLAAVVCFCAFPRLASAQVEAPDKKFIFLEDREEEVQAQEQKIRTRDERARDAARRKSKGLPFDIDATSIKVDSGGDVIRADGGVSIGFESGVIEASEGSFNVKTSEADISGEVRIGDSSGNIFAEAAHLNLDKGTGQLENMELRFNEGNYSVKARRAEKLPGQTFSFEDVEFTTCECHDDPDCTPWSITGTEGSVEYDGYGKVWNPVLRFYDVPVLYSPYLIFPAKARRQSGMLPATFGTGRRSGFKVELPFYWAIDEFSDATITPVYESRIRTGVEADYQRLFSRGSSLKAGGVYLDESNRGGDLLGTIITGLADPTLEKQRQAGYLKYNASTEVGDSFAQLVVDGRYVGDDLFLREFEKLEIGTSNSRFVTSQAAVRTTLFERYNAEVSTEYNQSLVSDDALVFQRLPEASLGGYNIFRPFGDNALGLKLVLSDQLSATKFDRDLGYDGSRFEIYEKARVPFHIRNYIEGEMQADIRASSYSLDEQLDPGSIVAENSVFTDVESESIVDEQDKVEEVYLPSSSDRAIPGFQLKTSTVMEKVFDLDRDSGLKRILNLGPTAKFEDVTRVKHTIEPLVRYRYVPDVAQLDTPQFDSTDRLPKRSVATYGVTQRLYSRSEPLNSYLYGIEESTPEVGDIQAIGSSGPLDDDLSFGIPFANAGIDEIVTEQGTIREVASFSLVQSYDFIEASEDLDPLIDPLSDVGAELLFVPNYHMRLRLQTNLDVSGFDPSSYAAETQFIDKFGDELRLRLNFISDQVRQLDSGVQIRFSDRIKLGYFSRFDDLGGEFIENRFGVRFAGSCNCWHIDFDLHDKLNPDETQFTVTLNLIGLGEFGNSFMRKNEDR